MPVGAQGAFQGAMNAVAGRMEGGGSMSPKRYRKMLDHHLEYMRGYAGIAQEQATFAHGLDTQMASHLSNLQSNRESTLETLKAGHAATAATRAHGFGMARLGAEQRHEVTMANTNSNNNVTQMDAAVRNMTALHALGATGVTVNGNHAQFPNNPNTGAHNTGASPIWTPGSP